MTSLVGKRVLVTGASSGIGEAIAIELASAGAQVGLCARRTDLLEKVRAACGADALAWTVDLADLDGIDGFARRVEDEMGGVDVLVNNAGLIIRGPARFEDVETLMRINYLSPVKLTLALLPAMVRRGSGQVLTVSSVAARMSPPTESAYTATKAAVTGFFESIAIDLWDTGVTFHLMYPGLIKVNDEPPDALHASVEPLPASDVAAGVRLQLETGAFESYVPPSFGEIYAARAQDVGGFVRGTAAWVKAQGI